MRQTVFTDRLGLDTHLRDKIFTNLQQFSVRQERPDALKRAAVALTIVDVYDETFAHEMTQHTVEVGDAAILITKRASSLKRHAGQWALPGGRIDTGESSCKAALRELSEEVGINLSAESVLGTLDDYITRSGFSITPLVVWGGHQPLYKPNPQEVASVHKIPLFELKRPDSPIIDSSLSANNPVLKIPVGSSWIAAPTAAFLYQFREVALQGRLCRVSHFDQPAFAWR